jgi:CRISPR/Cas system endoribonuclease Cas6 (RAMP superfamily)
MWKLRFRAKLSSIKLLELPESTRAFKTISPTFISTIEDAKEDDLIVEQI